MGSGLSPPGGITAFRKSYAGFVVLTNAAVGATYRSAPNETLLSLSTAAKRVSMSEAGTVKNIQLTIRDVPPAGVTHTVKLQKNAVDLATLTYTNADALGSRKTSATTSACVAGDDFQWTFAHSDSSTDDISCSVTFDYEVTP